MNGRRSDAFYPSRRPADASRSGTITITPRGRYRETLPEATLPRPADLLTAWRLAWAYADEHEGGDERTAWTAFQAIADEVDGPGPVGPDSLHGEQIMCGGVAIGGQPDYSKRATFERAISEGAPS